MKTIDAAIVGVSLLCAAFAAGLWIGTANHDAKAPAKNSSPSSS